jgi:hypothetical protein
MHPSTYQRYVARACVRNVSLIDLYDGLYQRLVEAGVVEKLDYVVGRDMDNNIVNTEADAFFRQKSYSLLHPDKLVFLTR